MKVSQQPNANSRLSRHTQMHRNTPEKINQAYLAIEHKVVETDQYVTAKNAINSMMRFAGIKSIGMTILAPTGLGKSTVLNKFVNNNLSAITADVIASVDYQFTPIPIISFEMPEQPTIKSVCEAILTAANHPDLTGNATTLTRRVDKLIEHQLVRFLIIDECQHLLREHAGKRTTEALNFIKNRMNKHKIIVIVAGIPTAEKALSEYAELSERLGYKKCYITEFEIDTDEGVKNFGSFLTGFDNLFAEIGINICTLYSPEMFDRLFLACAGSPRKFKYLLFNVLDLSSESEKKIKKDLFTKAYRDQQLNEQLGAFNPFSAKPEKVTEKLAEWEKLKIEKHKQLMKKNAKQRRK